MESKCCIEIYIGAMMGLGIQFVRQNIVIIDA